MSDVDMDDLEDAATRAALAARAHLNSFTSPRASTYRYQRDPEEWLMMEGYEEEEKEEEEDIDPAWNEDESFEEEVETMRPVSTPKRPPAAMQRSDTPVMSNQSKQKRMSPSILYQQLSPASPSLIVQRSAPSRASSHVEYQRFWEATLAFLATKRQHLERSSARTQQHEDDSMDAQDSGRERRLDIDFLQALQTACWETTRLQKQGTLWLLLAKMRNLGKEFLLWDDSETSQKSRQMELESFKDTLARKIDEHPKAILGYMRQHHDAPPFCSRYYTIVQWLEATFNHVLPSGVTRARQVQYLEKSMVLKQQGLPETNMDAELFDCSLALLLAGKTADAQQLWRDSNVPWRAVTFSGEEPHGFSYCSNPLTKRVDYEPTGNDRRALWRRFQWIKAKKMADKEIKSCCDAESAVHAVLGCNVQAALQNPKLCTWEKGLYVTFRSIVGRLEDEILHRHNNRRRIIGPFPGTQFEKREKEHLQATSEFANWDEAKVIAMLKTSPFRQMQCDGLISQVTSAFLVGRSSIFQLLQEYTEKIEAGEIQDESFLIFFVHLVVYLDTLTVGDASVDIPDIQIYKDRIVRCYLLTLASREDLWYLRVFYASMLPLEGIRECLPTLLLSIESPEERKTIVEQLRDYLPIPGFDVELLRLVMNSMIFKTAHAEMDPETPSPLDIQKMNSIQWLSFSSLHLSDALKYTNALFRQLFLANKHASAELFMDDILRGKDRLESRMLEHVDSESGDEQQVSPLEESKAEYAAYQLYLDAETDYREWVETIALSETCPDVVDDQVDMSRLDAASVAIAKQMEQRELLQQKRTVSNKLRVAAQNARSSLAAILQYPGGWLLMQNDGKVDNAGEDVSMMVLVEDGTAADSRVERLHLRSKVLPRVVGQYIEVCMETAKWMSSSLNDAVERLEGDSPSQILMRLDETVGASEQELIDSAFAPWCWTGIALDVGAMLVSETNDILAACDSTSLHAFGEQIASAKALHLMYDFDRKH